MTGRSGVIVNRNNFRAIGEQINERAAQVVRQTAIEVEQRAKDLAPVDTGALRAGIYTVTDRWNDYSQAVAQAQALNPKAKMLPSVQPVGPYEAGVGICVDYWMANEFGTVLRPARPFLTPAVEAAAPKFQADMREAMAGAIR